MEQSDDMIVDRAQALNQRLEQAYAKGKGKNEETGIQSEEESVRGGGLFGS